MTDPPKDVWAAMGEALAAAADAIAAASEQLHGRYDDAERKRHEPDPRR